ncbi:poly(A) polymerase [Streptoalloteichus tenebrarius]|uniref:Poly(A) polymerase n=1 Tax=Streptoalloteichus tenebrarius (strain ATCC 17920 / DSM 40477 / JCM 4838 / CBS 697.72 / NBRC 16177 / NCIMB 11028 / NRRL B-12390 / A12253. 1 / ISP 5477) TaxID=1933 RepID=A0ABT1I0S4_STRSD|nr:poly(A) polymerase [Streptoalloteichus tenebrarius]
MVVTREGPPSASARGRDELRQVPWSPVPPTNHAQPSNHAARPAPVHRGKAQRNAVLELLRIAPVADELAERFVAAGHRLYLVGGSVRDALLGRLGTDLDFTTDARPEQVQRVLSGWAEAVWDTGIAFGTVGATKRGATLEITTFRADVYDRTTRNPEVTFGDSIEGDLVRRDFTVNAMAVELPERRFVDPHDGMEALVDRVLDTPATPEESFADDPLRMLRAARFVSQLGFEPAPRVVTAMTAMAGEIERITAERVQTELSKLLCGAHPRKGIELLVDTGLADHVLPEVPAMRLEIDEHHQHKDVYHHSLVVLDQAIALEKRDDPDAEPDLVLRLAALLHDIGKPATRRFEPGGGVSFHHHEVVGAKMVRKRLRALRFSKEITEDVAKLVYLHLRFHGYGTGQWTDSAVRRYVTDAGPLLSRLHKLVRADCTTRNRRKAQALQRTYDDLEARIQRLSDEEDLRRVRPDLDGNEIMRLLGLPPGPLVGRAWKHLKELRLDRGPLEHDEAVAELFRWAREQGIDVPDQP